MLALASDNLKAIVEARMALELGLVTLAAEKIDAENLAKLKETIEVIENENSKDNNYSQADEEFHRIIALSADNPVVEGMIDSLIITRKKIDSEIKVRQRELTIEHHKAIYQALVNRDPMEAFQKMYQHLEYVRKKVLSYHGQEE
jgi:GntR family transcriptional regulator, transcriptional repressor for pyruvate dehydrogenase complex